MFNFSKSYDFDELTVKAEGSTYGELLSSIQVLYQGRSIDFSALTEASRLIIRADIAHYTRDFYPAGELLEELGNNGEPIRTYTDEEF